MAETGPHQQPYAPPQYAPPPQAAYPPPPYPQQPQPPQPNYPPLPPAFNYPPQGQVHVAPYQPLPPPPARSGLPTWLMTVLFAFAFLGLGAGVYWLLGAFKSDGSASKPPATVESPAAKAGAKTSPYQKWIEVAGVRFTQDGRKKPQVKFVIINHSGAELSGIGGNVTVWGRTQKSEEEAAGTFVFNTTLGPFESKELSAPLTTKLSMVELPDWQNVSTDVQITAPASGGSGGLP